MKLNKVLITGSSNGIGLSATKKFLELGYQVIGFDILNSTIVHDNYIHYNIDITEKDKLPDIDNLSIIINNAGTQNSGRDIENNLIGAMNITEKYAFQSSIKSVLFNASASAHTGFEFTDYSVSKAGLIGYMKNCAWRLANSYKATCNSISCGGVITDLNSPVLSNKDLWNDIMKVTPLKKWATADEIADWIYFLTVINKSASGCDFLIDNGETFLRNSFIWPGFNE